MQRDQGLVATLRHLYSLEINCGLSSFWDGGWTAWIGDELNGYRATADLDRVEEVAAWLRAEAANVIRGWRRERRALKRRESMAVVA
jgi:hypothetical protein